MKREASLDFSRSGSILSVVKLYSGKGGGKCIIDRFILLLFQIFLHILLRNSRAFFFAPCFEGR